jgi:L-ascorbate metabolism protein UlaG (beta-lactamase superfamily)
MLLDKKQELKITLSAEGFIDIYPGFFNYEEGGHTMSKIFVLAILFMIGMTVSAHALEQFEKDLLKTSAGDLEITFLGHGTLMFTFGGKVIHVDPYSKVADYAKLPQADLILITHDHGDHLDPAALKPIRTEKTIVILTEACAPQVAGGTVMKNGDVQTVLGIKIEAVPAYNIVNKRNGQPYHPKGSGNGYILTFGDKRVYIAGDTENTPEMKALTGIDVAFLPMNLPYTMTPEMVADAAKVLKPKILYPYHYGDTDTSKLVELLKDTKEIEVRIRNMK